VKKIAHGTPDFKAGASIDVQGLSESGVAQGWAGTGEYIVPLTSRTETGGATVHEVTPLPLSPGYAPLFVTVELRDPGPESDKAVEAVHKYLGRDIQLAKGILRRNVPRQQADEFKSAMDAAKARVALHEGDNRIYRATPDALAQLAEINIP